MGEAGRLEADEARLAGTGAGARAGEAARGAPAARGHPLAALGLRDYRLLWLGQLGTTMGLWMDQTTRTWLIYTLTGSAFDLGAVNAVRAIPTLAFGVIAGVLADRYNRKGQLVVSQTVNAALNLVLAVLITAGRIEPWHVYVTALIAGTVQAFQQPARQSLVSDLVGRPLLLNAVALNSAVFNLSRTLGPAFAGLLIAWVGIDGSYYIQALMYLWATLWTVQMFVPRARPRAADAPSLRADIMEGIHYSFFDARIRPLMLFGLVPTLIAMPYVGLMPIFARDILEIGAQGQGLLLTSAGVGALCGALSLALIGPTDRKGLSLLISAGLFGLWLMAFSLSTSVPLSLCLLFLAGIANTTYGSQDQTIIQLMAPDHARGRVLSLYLMNRGLSPLGGLLAGAVAAWLGGPAAVFLMGLTTLLAVLWFAWRVPQIRELRL